MTADDSDQWDTTIESAGGWHMPDLTGLWRYRDLVMLFVRRDSVATYKQSVLGPLWFVIQPLMTTLVYTIVFGRIMSISTDGVSPVLFYFAGVLSWQYFAGNLTKTADTFGGNAGIYGKVYFPRLVTPVSVIISNLIQFGIQFAVFLCVIFVYKLRGAPVMPTWWALLTPLLLLQFAALGLGMGLIISTLTTRYRDLSHLLGYGMQLWMYATPVVYPLSSIPQKWVWLAYLNPATSMVQAFRYALLGNGAPDAGAMLYSIVATAVVLAIGLALFSRVERSFMDTI